MNLRRRIRKEQGQTLVEVAIGLPVLLLVLFAILQFGIVFKNYLALTDAVRVGARVGAVSRDFPDPRGRTEAAVRSAGTDLGAGLQVTVTSTWTPGSDLTVKGTFPYCINVMSVVVRCGNLSSQTIERVN
jgi:Flp pilus assembly protein TadG